MKTTYKMLPLTGLIDRCHAIVTIRKRNVIIFSTEMDSPEFAACRNRWPYHIWAWVKSWALIGARWQATVVVRTVALQHKQMFCGSVCV